MICSLRRCDRLLQFHERMQFDERRKAGFTTICMAPGQGERKTGLIADTRCRKSPYHIVFTLRARNTHTHEQGVAFTAVRSPIRFRL